MSLSSLLIWDSSSVILILWDLDIFEEYRPLICGMSLSLGLPGVSFWLDVDYIFLAKNKKTEKWPRSEVLSFSAEWIWITCCRWLFTGKLLFLLRGYQVSRRRQCETVGVPSGLQPPGWAPFWFLLETVFTMMATKWWFSNSVITSAFIYFTFYCKKELFLLPCFSFVYSHQRGPMASSSVGYNPLLIVYFDAESLQVWRVGTSPFCDLLICPHESLSTSLPRTHLALPWLSSAVSHFSKGPWFHLVVNVI